MQRIILALCAFIMVEFVAIPVTGQAQGISLGIDEGQIFRALRARGYSGMKVVRRRLASIRVHACKEGSKFELKAVLGGIITDTDRIGRCDLDAQDRNFANENRMERSLKERGYEDIEIQRGRRGYRVTACRDGEQEIFSFTLQQELLNRQRAGRCARRSISSKQAAALLKDEGFTAIKIVDDRRAPYKIEACKGNDKFEFLIGRRGRVRDQQKTGSCRKPIQVKRLAEILEDRGYDRVRVLRDNRRPYLAEACKERDLMELRINRFGDVLRDDRIGRCPAPLSKNDLTNRLTGEGYLVLDLKQRKRGWLAEVCRDETKLALRVSSRGRIRGQEAIGNCASQSVIEVLENLEKRGAKKLTAIVEGCFKGNRYHWFFDRLGNRTGRERVGNCN